MNSNSQNYSAYVLYRIQIKRNKKTNFVPNLNHKFNNWLRSSTTYIELQRDSSKVTFHLKTFPKAHHSPTNESRHGTRTGITREYSRMCDQNLWHNHPFIFALYRFIKCGTCDQTILHMYAANFAQPGGRIIPPEKFQFHVPALRKWTRSQSKRKRYHAATKYVDMDLPLVISGIGVQSMQWPVYSIHQRMTRKL